MAEGKSLLGFLGELGDDEGKKKPGLPKKPKKKPKKKRRKSPGKSVTQPASTAPTAPKPVKLSSPYSDLLEEISESRRKLRKSSPFDISKIYENLGITPPKATLPLDTLTGLNPSGFDVPSISAGIPDSFKFTPRRTKRYVPPKERKANIVKGAVKISLAYRKDEEAIYVDDKEIYSADRQEFIISPKEKLIQHIALSPNRKRIAFDMPDSEYIDDDADDYVKSTRSVYVMDADGRNQCEINLSCLEDLEFPEGTPTQAKAKQRDDLPPRKAHLHSPRWISRGRNLEFRARLFYPVKASSKKGQITYHVHQTPECLVHALLNARNEVVYPELAEVLGD